MRKSFLYALIGVTLGFAVPLGALGLLWLSPHPVLQLPHFIAEEWRDHLFFFTYMLAASTLSFGFFGYFLGRDSDIIEVQNRDLSLLANRDELTGLGNHRFLHEIFKIEFRKHLSDHKPISCLMMDLDHFKKVNDSHGHIFGDHVLKHFAALVKKTIRAGDVAIRYGGEEFLCVLPDCGREKAWKVAERIRTETEKHPVIHGRTRARVTVSLGAVTSYGGEVNYPRLIALADHALYQAKRHGRNQVAQTVLSPSPGDARPGNRGPSA